MHTGSNTYKKAHHAMYISWQVPMNDEVTLYKQLEALKDQHRDLDREISAVGDSSWDELRLARLKKEKLRLRDKIYSLESEIYPDQPA